MNVCRDALGSRPVPTMIIIICIAPVIEPAPVVPDSNWGWGRPCYDHWFRFVEDSRSWTGVYRAPG